MQLVDYSNHALQSILNNIDDDSTIRRIVITFKNSTLDFSAVGNVLDSFLTPRPWWKPVREPFNWQKHINKREIILEKCSSEWEPFFRYLAVYHFPRADICEQTTLLVGRSSCVHPGWFSVLSFYRMTFGSHPYAIHANYYPELADRANSSAWISPSDCPPNMKNLWTCAFLTTTNCSFPKYVTDCNMNECNNEQNDGFSLYLDKAAVDGKKIPQANIASSGRSPPPTGSPIPFPISTSLPSAFINRPYDKDYVLRNYQKFDVLNPVDLTSAAYVHRFLVRPNHFYRSRIAQMIHRFRASSSPHLNATARCVAVQLRRGDRAIPEHLDPVEWCYNASHKLPCNGGYCNPDLGCSENGGVPFASINLTHVIEKIPVLVGPDVKNIIVASDDPDWVERQIIKMKLLAPEWNIYTLSPPRLREVVPRDEPIPGYHYMRAEGGTESGTFLFASLELATQCEGFIGHMGSGSTMMYHQYMCLNHAGTRGICPPTYDMRAGIWLNSPTAVKI